MRLTLYRLSAFVSLILITSVGALNYMQDRHIRSSINNDGSIRFETMHSDVLLPHTHAPGDAASDTAHHVTFDSSVLVAPTDLYVQEAYFDLHNAHPSTLHHASLVDISRPNVPCSNFLNWRELIGYASDRVSDGSLIFPSGHALYIPKGTPLKLHLMLHNPSLPIGPGDTYDNVFATLTLILSTSSPSHLKKLAPHLLHLDDIPCGYKNTDLSDSHTFTVPPLAESYTYHGQKNDPSIASFTFPHTTTLTNIIGHMHAWQGGQYVSLFKNGTLTHTFFPVRSPNDPFVVSISPGPDTIPVEAGDRVSISATYNNPHPTPTRGAMGMVAFYYVLNE